MSNDKTKPKKKKLEIKERAPGKATENYMANVTPLRSPIADIFEFPAPNQIAPPEKSDVAVHQVNDLPSTVFESAVHHQILTPSTDEESSRPPVETVDVLPSTSTVLPSTKPPKKPAVDVLPSTENKISRPPSKTVDGRKGDRHVKNSARYDNRIDDKIKQQIDVFCAKNNMTQKDFAEMSAVHLINWWTAENKKVVDGKTALDDRLKMMNTKTDARIINLYRAYNFENQWRFRDDEVAHAYNKFDLRIIEIGIIVTQIQAKFKRIQSFSYYKNEIDKTIEAKNSEQMLGFLIEHYRKNWRYESGRELNLSIIEDSK